MLPKAWNSQHKHALILVNLKLQFYVLFLKKSYNFLEKAYYPMKMNHTNGFMLPKDWQCQHKYAFILVNFKNAISFVCNCWKS